MVTKKRGVLLHPTHKKRLGLHHKKGKQYHSVYWPYLPLVMVSIIGLFTMFWQPMQSNVLAYATNTSTSGLLSATNAQRANYGSASLSLNSKLGTAAQNKANDMAARNYWSHNTPEGDEPWVFFDAVSYAYLKAGENLAYGFPDSGATITGWMNSPGHKANLIDTAFTEVGFGMANNANYQSNGPQTIVVAMYGKPQVQSVQSSTPAPAPSAPQSTPAPTPAPTPTPSPAPTPTPSSAAAGQEAAPAKTPAPTESTPDIVINSAPVTSDTPVIEHAPKAISKLDMILGGKVPWATFIVGFTTGMAIVILLIKHSLALHKLLISGEHFFMHHPLFDAALLGLVVLGMFLTKTTGFIV